MMAAHNNEIGKTLKALLQGIVEVADKDDCAVTGLSLHSNEIEPGNIFFAVSGYKQHGLNFAADAIKRGACAVLWEDESGKDDVVMLDSLKHQVPLIPLVNLKQKVGVIAERFLGEPSRQLYMVGVTGTNGKTSCSQFLAQALTPDEKCCVIGTLGNGFVDQLTSTQHTTPDAISLHYLLADYKQKGASSVVMEVSSHGLSQGRVAGIAFDMAIFTNLSRDHLDYHGDMESYAGAKKLLFKNPGLKKVIVNIDDEFGREIAESMQSDVDVIRYGIDQQYDVDVRAHKIRTDNAGLHFDVITPWGSAIVSSGLFGRFNVSNLLAVFSALLAKGLRFEEAVSRVCNLKSVPGRMELIPGQAGAANFIVDYAHTPDALEKALRSLRGHTGKKSRSKLWCVFGCGGDRDPGKRGLMGEIAEQFADHVIITDDNPRTEAASHIVSQILEGMLKQQDVVIIHDRIEAIRHAMGHASADDVVLVAGKGHEAYQIIGEQRRDYVGDANIVRSFMKERPNLAGK
jgi:UDP-N-acetylmuramoyl-L-alanyl-D-glutamate--2,6-diaminopimelate ligase